MTKRTAASALVVMSLALVACEPETSGPAEPRGALEYEHPSARIYRLERRVEVALVEGDVERWECGMLSERAYSELRATREALDPSRDYGYDPSTQECQAPPGALVYVDGLEHSPFACEWYCCHPDLVQAALVYSLVESHFRGGMPMVDGEAYVAIEADEPCP